MLRFSLLGTFAVTRDGVPIPATAWRTKQGLQTLRVLLDSRDRPTAAERIADLVWPDADPAAARNSLQSAIRALRRALEPDLVRGADSKLIRTEAEAYRFVAGDSAVDVDAFVAFQQRAVAAERRGDTAAAVEAYGGAVALYRGDYLADERADWPIATRERLREVCITAVERLAALRLASGDELGAIAAAERGLEMEPAREELFRVLMRAHARAGRRSHALATFDRCRAVLGVELGVTPDAATLRLRDQIASASSASATLQPASSISIPFTGREREIKMLRDAWTTSARAAGPVIVVSGPAGVGKSRLAERFVDDLDSSVRVVRLVARETDRDRAFGPVIDAVTAVARASRALPLRALGPRASILAHVVPAVRETLPEIAEAVVADTSQIVDALTAALFAGRGTARTLVVFEDVHVADRASLGWLTFASRQAPAGTLFLATTRDVTVPSPSADRLELTLADLSAVEIRVLVGSLVRDEAVAARLAERLVAEIGGNPLYLGETLRDLAARGELIPEATGYTIRSDAPFAVAASVRDQIMARVARLDEMTSRVLHALALIDAPADAVLLADVSGSEAASVLSCLELLLAQRFVLAFAGAPAYGVAHPIVAHALRESLGGASAELHRRIADAYERRDAGAGRVLPHLVAAGADAGRIRTVAIAAGEDALRRGLYGDAIAHLERARDAGSRDDPLVLERLGDAYGGAERADDAIAHFGLVADAAGTELLTRARALRKRANQLGSIRGRFSEALESLAQADAELAGQSGGDMEVERGRIALTRATTHFFRSDFRGTLSEAERALRSLRRRPGTERDVIEAYARAGTAHQRLGDLAAAERGYREAIGRSRAIGDAVLEAQWVDQLSGVPYNAGRVRESLEMVAGCRAVFLAHGARRSEMIWLNNYASKLEEAGEIAAAKPHVLASLELARALDAKYTLMHATVTLAEIEVRAGAVAEAERTLAEGVTLADAMGSRQRRAHADLAAAMLALVLGDPAAARARAESAIAIGKEIGDSRSLREGPSMLAHVALLSGDTREALARAEESLQRARSGGFEASEARALLERGLARWADGDGAASADLERAARYFRDRILKFDLARTLLLRAATDLRGHTRKTAAARDEGRALAREIGAGALLRTGSLLVAAGTPRPA